jgi:6-phosphogluconolactonase (cycloisomerase 2 family)
MAFARTRRLLPLLAALALALSTVVATGATALARTSPAAVYTMTNAADGNAVVRFERSASGLLAPAGVFPTGGLGNGGGLGSQGALVLSGDGRWLLAVNAGSDEVSVFRVLPHGLQLTDTAASGGDMPISVTVSGSLVYVLNAGGDGNISGFRLHPNGRLRLLANSTRALSGAGVGPAQVQFTPDGAMLVVTEKNTNLIDTFLVGPDGTTGSAVVNPSNGATPFGFEFAPDGTLIVSEAFGGAVDASALSSYVMNTDGTLALISGSVATTETAACWVVVTPDGRYTYTTNTGSGSVSGYAVGSDGSLTLLDGDGVTGTTGGGPIDAIIAGGFLYTLDSGSDAISIFAINADGSLTSVGTVAGLAGNAVGITGR